MRNVFYDSSYLDRTVYIADIQSVGRNDLNVLECELKVVISSMRQKCTRREMLLSLIGCTN